MSEYKNVYDGDDDDEIMEDGEEEEDRRDEEEDDDEIEECEVTQDDVDDIVDDDEGDDDEEDNNDNSENYGKKENKVDMDTQKDTSTISVVRPSFTQDSTLMTSIRNNDNAEYTQDTLEQEYEDEDDDKNGNSDFEDEPQRNDDELPHVGQEAGADGAVDHKGTEENEDDTSVEEAEVDEDIGKVDTMLEEDTEATKVDGTSGKSNQTKPEATSYSTRGRTQEENNFDRLAAVGDLLSLGATHRDAATTSLLQSPETRMRESFLSDSLTEEERRTRTRYLPSVDGMHALRKQEIKNDLALARSTLSAGGITEKIARATKRKSPDDEATANDAVDTNAMKLDDGIHSAEEDKTSIGVTASKTVEIGTTTLSIPSYAFVAPSIETGTKKATPREVDVNVAFNPPRPPESIGAKKKHRMLRWERRPSDIETDLNSYRKTVQKTREELKSAEGELQRIRVVDNQLRRQFFEHIQCMNSEIKCIGDEIATVQQECVDMSDLPNSRTRTRGAFKGSNTMKDVLQTLRVKGKEVEAKGLFMNGGLKVASHVAGVGGVSASSFVDWDRTTTIKSSKLAEAWVVPGEKVTTPYGVGIVHSVYGPTYINPAEPPSHDLFPKSNSVAAPVEAVDAMEIDEAENQSVSVNSTSSKKKIPKIGKKLDSAENSTVSLVNAIAPRIAVRLPFGIAFFNLESVKPDDDPATYTDDQLAKRWLGLAETASMFGSSIDVSAMGNIISPDKKGDPDDANDDMTEEHKTTKRLVPFGSGMLPTAVGRGTNLHKLSIVELDETVNKVFFKGHGVLGNENNLGVPTEVRNLEDSRQESLNLQAKVLQLRNQLYRQRRIRMLNERTFMSSHERAAKIESLVAEMRMDLKSLKGRLDLEIRDLGISDDQAESILKAFYTSQDTQLNGEVSSPPSRSRRLSQMDEAGDGNGFQSKMETDVAGADTDVSMVGPDR